MSVPVPSTTKLPRHWRQRLRSEWMLVLFAALALTLAAIDPQPLARYRTWAQWPTLAGLLGLLIAIQGVRDSGLVQHAAWAVVARAHSVRTLGLLLVSASALLSMVLTNDASLLLIIPLTAALGALSNLPVLRMVILEALAVNAGATLSPIGNPQNLLLWQHSSLSMAQFAWAMAPAFSVMLALVLALTWMWLPAQRVAITPTTTAAPAIAQGLGRWSLLALALMVLAMQLGLATWGAALLLAVGAWRARDCLRRVDWGLWLTFAAIFIALGHLAALPLAGQVIDALALNRPGVLYTVGILAAQAVSNVPATVLLIDHVPNVLALATAVNVGGFGLVTGSLANLIALRLAGQTHALRVFHQVSIPFLLLCAPLVYLVTRMLGA
ncbi:MAG: SLC13 family permease [Rhodanobacter sp.]